MIAKRLNSVHVMELLSCFSSQRDELGEIVHCLCNGIPHRKQYPPVIRSFCMSLHFHSPRAYVFLREKFNKNLPHIETLRSWYRNSNIDGEPGINSHSIRILNDKAAEMRNKGKQLLCALIFDEMSIHKSVEWCPKDKTFVGYDNLGDRRINNENREEVLVSQAIAYFVSGINTPFQLPLAYFFVHSLNADQRFEYLKQILFELSKCDVRIGSVTFDGYAANIPMCRELGATIGEEIEPVFENPYTGDTVQLSSMK